MRLSFGSACVLTRTWARRFIVLPLLADLHCPHACRSCVAPGGTKEYGILRSMLFISLHVTLCPAYSPTFCACGWAKHAAAARYDECSLLTMLHCHYNLCARTRQRRYHPAVPLPRRLHVLFTDACLQMMRSDFGISIPATSTPGRVMTYCPHAATAAEQRQTNASVKIADLN